MHSSPEARRWELADLRVEPAVIPAADTALPLFEVGTSAGVPDSLLAPARAAAHAAGYAAGWANGMRMAEQRAALAAERARVERDQALADQRVAVARGIAALQASAESLEVQAIPGAEQLESLLLEAAFGIAEALVGHALGDSATRAPAALRRVLALAPHGEPVTVRLSPADHALLADYESTERAVTLVADPSLDPGDAVAACGATEVESRIRAGLQRVREALGQ